MHAYFNGERVKGLEIITDVIPDRKKPAESNEQKTSNEDARRPVNRQRHVILTLIRSECVLTYNRH